MTRDSASAPGITPRAFACEVAGIVGHHAVTWLSLRLDALEQSFVADHEAIHDELIHETPDGEWLRWLAIAASSADAAERTVGEAWFARVMLAMMQVQESAATYLSIKRLPPVMHAYVLRQHPAAYREHHAILAAAVDPWFESSYLQWIVARAIVDVSLSSRAIEGFAAWPVVPGERLPPEYCGDERFTAVLLVFRTCARALADQVADWAHGAGIPGRGSHVDHEFFWTALTNGEQRALEASLRPKIHEFIESHASRAVPVLPRARWAAALSQFEVEFAARFPAAMRSPLLRLPLLEPLGNTMGFARYRRALREAGVDIALQPEVDPRPLPWLAAVSALTDLGPVALVQDEEDDACWTIARRRRGGVGFVARLRAACSELALADLPAESMVLVNIPAPQTTVVAHAEALRALARNGVSVCCYLRGSHMSWLAWLSEEPGAQLTLLFLSGTDSFEVLPDTAPASDIHDLSSVTMHIIACPGLPGVGLRLTATKATAFLAETEIVLGDLAALAAGCSDNDVALAIRATTLARIWKKW